MTSATAVTRFHVPDMQCAGCAGSIEKALESLAGVESIATSLEDKTVSVTSSQDADSLRRAIKNAGYSPEVIADG